MKATMRLAATGAVAFFLFAAALQAAGRQVLANHVPPAAATARRMGPLSRVTRLNLAIGLPLRNQSELERLLRDVSDPASPHYREYLSSEEFTQRFGPSESDYQAVVAFAESHGLKVLATHPNRMILDVSGTVAAIESVFQINLAAWNDDVRGSFYAPDSEPSLDLDVPILDITGLDNYITPRPMGIKANPLTSMSRYAGTGSGPSGLLIGNDFRAAYAPGVKLTGAGQTIGLFELDGFYANDVQANFKAAGLPPVPVQTVLLDGVNGAPGGANIEVMLDIMMAAYMAPGVSKIVVYEGNNWNDVLNRMATDNVATQLSCSWGFSPINATTEQIFRQMIAQGQSFFQASGDSGAYTGWIMPPSDNPNVTVVGGTHLSTTGPAGQWLSETVWPGSGGGVSTTYAIPAYQQGLNMAAIGGSSTRRNIPDVAMTADVQMFLIQNNGQGVAVGGTSAAAPLWAGFLALVNQQAAAKGIHPVGFVNPAIYAIGGGPGFTGDFHDIVTGNNNGFDAAPGFDLATGWGTPSGQSLIDQLTGTQNAPSFTLSASPAAISIVQGSSASGVIGVVPQNGFSASVAFGLSGLPAGVTGSFSSGGASSSTLTLSAGPSAATGTVTVTVTGTSGSLKSIFLISLTVTPPPAFTISAAPASVTLAQGTAAKSTISIARLNGFSGSVALTASGLPAGVTAAFAQGSAAGTSTLTFTASASASPGTAVATITGTSAGITKTATVSITVTPAPTFSLTASPATLTVIQGSTASNTITVTPQNGFSGSVSLSVSGLSSGLTASFSQNTATTGSTLNFSASASAATGPATITVTGTSGSLTKTATISVTIAAAPSYSLSAAPASLSVAQGNAASSTITLTGQNGFSGKVNLTASGLPAGVTASFNQAATSGASIVTIFAANTATPGTAVAKISGTAGTLTKTTTIALTVLPAPDYALSTAEKSLTVLEGTIGAGVVRIAVLNGFNGNIGLVASGLPAGVTARFSPVGTAGLNIIRLAVARTAAAGTSTVTITGTSGSLVRTTTLALTILAPANGTQPVDLSSVNNVSGAAVDGVPFTGGGLDALGRSWSGILLGASQVVNGVAFSIAPMNGPDVVSATKVPLPAGQFAALKMLAVAVNGNQPAQTFTVNYTDGTRSAFTQSLSDWYTPQNYGGEITALTMPYRDNSTGSQDGRQFLVYEYSFNLTPGKTVSSIALPNNRNVVVLALTLTGGASH